MGHGCSAVPHLPARHPTPVIIHILSWKQSIRHGGLLGEALHGAGEHPAHPHRRLRDLFHWLPRTLTPLQWSVGTWGALICHHPFHYYFLQLALFAAAMPGRFLGTVVHPRRYKCADGLEAWRAGDEQAYLCCIVASEVESVLTTCLWMIRNQRSSPTQLSPTCPSRSRELIMSCSTESAQTQAKARGRKTKQWYRRPRFTADSWEKMWNRHLHWKRCVVCVRHADSWVERTLLDIECAACELY